MAEEPRQQQGGAGAGEAPEGGAPVVIQSYAVSEPAATKEAKSFTTLRPESVALASKVRRRIRQAILRRGARVWEPLVEGDVLCSQNALGKLHGLAAVSET